ncbi:hypothetical protein ENBRE01_0458 [Enteropsectra breve]|nr:hypothetical protein ENBRE01_0458 [Enteropsectra breve]
MSHEDTLEHLSNEIEEDFQKCAHDLKRVGNLLVKVQSFANRANKIDSGDGKYRVLAEEYMQRLKMLTKRRAADKQATEQEMARARLQVKQISEMNDPGSENSFYSTQNSKLDSFISSAIDSVSSLKRQQSYIDSISDKIRHGLSRAESISFYGEKIKQRYRQDKTYFIAGAIVFSILVLVLIIKF